MTGFTDLLRGVEEPANCSEPDLSGVVISYCDGSGVEFKEFDIVKVFHFTGARRKKHYMYKRVRKDKKGIMCFEHLDTLDNDFVWLSIVCKSTCNGFAWLNSEIVQSNSL